MANYSDEIKDSCKRAYIRRAKVVDISREFKVPRRTLYSWIEKGNWDDLIKTDEVLEALERKIVTILDKDILADGDLNAIERLMSVRDKEFKRRSHASEAIIMAGMHDKQQRDAVDPKKISERKTKARKGKRSKNDLTGITPEEVEENFLKGLFNYQVQAWRTRHKRVRFILKSRQIGWTFLSAREAFADALITGKNKAFLSASKSQAQLFKNYIVAFALEWFDCELKGGDKIVIRTDHGNVTFYFLSTNSSTSQGPSGDVYIDECFWIRDFKKLKDLAGAIATQDQYTKTYFSTPSTKSHQAYELWSGETYKEIQKKRPKLAPFKMPTAKQLRKGHDCVDGIYRQVINIHDAMAGGANFFNLEYLELENDPETFAQLYECRFIDDTNSAFTLEDLLACGKPDTRWPDFKPTTERPFGNKEVWIGYDPARKRDSAAIVVMAPPAKPGGKFRLLEKIMLDNQNWAYQAQVIKELTEKYNVGYIGIDSTGPGNGVFERVQEFFPAATEISYTPETKTRLVLKAQEIISQKRVEWDEGYTDIPQAFLAIRKTCTESAIKFVAARDNNKGHADIAWAIMHVLIKEGLRSIGSKKTKVVIKG